VLELLVTANVPSSPVLVTLMMETILLSRTLVFKQPHGITSKKMAFFTMEFGHDSLKTQTKKDCASEAQQQL
jgi:hypothetical protein